MVRRETERDLTKREIAGAGTRGLINELRVDEPCRSPKVPASPIDLVDASRLLASESGSCVFSLTVDEPKPKTIAERLKTGEEALQKGKFEEAEKCANEILAEYRNKKDKEDPEQLIAPQILLARSMRAQKKHATKEYDEAIRLQLMRKNRLKIEIAELYYEKGDNLTTCDAKQQDTKAALEAITEGIKQLKSAPIEENSDGKHIDRNWLFYDLYSASASVKTKLKDTVGATEDEKLAEKHQGYASLWGPRGYKR
jgi:tetratricopeptide (TPR) repeat protein